jgi:hypothetical protein
MGWTLLLRYSTCNPSAVKGRTVERRESNILIGRSFSPTIFSCSSEKDSILPIKLSTSCDLTKERERKGREGEERGEQERRGKGITIRCSLECAIMITVYTCFDVLVGMEVTNEEIRDKSLINSFILCVHRCGQLVE